MTKNKKQEQSTGVTRRRLIQSATAAAVLAAGGTLSAQGGKPAQQTTSCDTTTPDTKSFHALALWLAVTTNPDLLSCGQAQIENSLGLPSGSLKIAWDRIHDIASFPSGTQLSSPADMYVIVRHDFLNFIANVYTPIQCPKSLQPIIKISNLYA
jgi:hypothetical protein